MRSHPLHGRRHRGTRIGARRWTVARARRLIADPIAPYDGHAPWTLVPARGEREPLELVMPLDDLDELDRQVEAATSHLPDGPERGEVGSEVYHRLLVELMNAHAVPVPKGVR